MKSMKVDMIPQEDTLIVRLHGELDHHQAESVRMKLEHSLQSAHIRNIVLNCEQLTFMDSSGIGVILGRYKQIHPRQGRLIICHVNDLVKRLFELAGLLKIATIVLDEREALLQVGVPR